MSYDLMEEISSQSQQLDIAVKSLRKTGSDFAEAEMNYKIKLREEALKLRDTLPATLIQLTVYGVREVAELRMKRDIAEAVYKANLESINSIKLRIRILDNQISREWTHETSN